MENLRDKTGFPFLFVVDDRVPPNEVWAYNRGAQEVILPNGTRVLAEPDWKVVNIGPVPSADH
jgi:hypothetical protein